MPGLLTAMMLGILFRRWNVLKRKTKIGIVIIPVAMVSMIVSAFAGVGLGAIASMLALAGGCATIPDYSDPVFQ